MANRPAHDRCLIAFCSFDNLDMGQTQHATVNSLNLRDHKHHTLHEPTNCEMTETFMELSSLRLNWWSFFTKAYTLELVGIVTAVFFSCVFTKDCLAAPILSSVQTAKQWEDIAKLRQQIARDHEIQSRNMANGNGSNTLDAGDLLDLAGDETFLAAENYQMASQQWDKAAMAYVSAGASVEAKKARENVNTDIAAAKRALSDGVYYHMKAKEQYEATNNLNKKMHALAKAARNLERLMEMK
jgi:hypothetical protein